MNTSHRRRSPFGRWMPVVLYAFMVVGWFSDGVSADAGARFWLVLWAVPAPAIYLWRTRRRGA